MDMSLSKLQELVMDREAWRAAAMESQRVGHDWVTELTEWLQNWYFLFFGAKIHNSYIQMNVILFSDFSCLGFDLTSVLTSEVNFSHFIFNIPRVLLLVRTFMWYNLLGKENHPLRLFDLWKQSFEVSNRGWQRDSIWL